MRFLRLIAGLITVAALLFVAGCQVEETLGGIKHEKPLPEKIVKAMKAKGMSKSSPILIRIFKEEGVLEVWKQKDTGRYDMITSYPICTWSGRLGPKFIENDRQAPEGFYTVRPAQMNPNSKFHLSFNMGFPNAYDRANGRTGAHLMVHGACSSAGCYSMNDRQMEEIFAFARDAFRGGQKEFQIQSLPFRMTPENMARYRSDPNFDFWMNLKEGYDHFELTKLPPKVDVCERRYVFNRIAPEGTTFSPTGACPPAGQPEKLVLAYETHRNSQNQLLATLSKRTNFPEPKPSIDGVKEAKVVAAWQRERVRGRYMGKEPPYFSRPAAPQATKVVSIPKPTGISVLREQPPAPANPVTTAPAQATGQPDASGSASQAIVTTAPATGQPATVQAPAPRPVTQPASQAGGLTLQQEAEAHLRPAAQPAASAAPTQPATTEAAAPSTEAAPQQQQDVAAPVPEARPATKPQVTVAAKAVDAPFPAAPDASGSAQAPTAPASAQSPAPAPEAVPVPTANPNATADAAAAAPAAEPANAAPAKKKPWWQLF